MVIGIYGRLCEVETGQNNIILDIEESRGNCKYLFRFILLFMQQMITFLKKLYSSTMHKPSFLFIFIL